jgi:2-keto-3-deoxy-L-fuconate dehydrogenase
MTASIITGGSSGMAFSVAQLLAEESKVYILDIHPPAKKTNNIEFIKCDISDSTQVDKAIASIVSSHQVKKCFFSAGYIILGKVTEVTNEAIDKIINVNVKGMIYSLRAILPHMVKNNFGRIVLMGSDRSIVAKPNAPIYGLTKAAIASLVKTTAIDFASNNIRVNGICPGSVKTALMENLVAERAKLNGTTIEAEYEKVKAGNPIKSIGTPEEVAKVVMLMLSEDINFMTGSLVSIDGGTTAT